MKGFLFFAGSLLRWPPQQPQQFLLFHAYIGLVYLLTYFASSAQGFIFTLGMFMPLFLAIIKGLPLDCLDYQAAMIREFDVDVTKQ